MKPSSRIEQIVNENEPQGIWIDRLGALIQYLDEQYEKKQFENQNVIGNNTFYQINDSEKS